MQSETWTVRRVLAFCTEDFRSKGIESARLDGELLIAHALGVARVALYMDLDRPLTKVELAAIRTLVTRRRAREPIAYILGRREFWSRDFEVGPSVLVPRPETETLVERALAILAPTSQACVLDLGTGSGCIAVTLAAERPAIDVDAVDLSEEALAVARRNAECHAVDARVRFRKSDLFSALPADARYDLLVSNPPYIAADERLPEDVRFEPDLALFAGVTGMDVIERIAADAAKWMQPNGRILIEIGSDQGSAARQSFASAGFCDVVVLPDLSGRDRVLEARKAED